MVEFSKKGSVNRGPQTHLSQTQHALGAHESQPEKNYAIHAQTASTGARLRRIYRASLGNGVSAAPGGSRRKGVLGL